MQVRRHSAGGEDHKAESVMRSNAVVKSIFVVYSGTPRSRQRCSSILYTIR